MKGDHLGINLAAIIIEILDSYSLLSRLLTITVDNYDNNDIIRMALQHIFRKRSIEWDVKTHTIKYISHIINLIVEALIKRLDATPINSKEIRHYKERRINKIKDNGSFSVIIYRVYISYF